MTLQPSYTFPNEKHPLFLHYPTQNEPQPAHVEITEDGLVEYGVSYEIGNSVPESVFHDRTVRITGLSPNLTREGISKLDREIRPLLERIAEGHSVEWDGHNHVGRLTEGASEAVYELGEFLQNTDWNNYDLADPDEQTENN